jgi:hypothetical protein
LNFHFENDLFVQEKMRIFARERELRLRAEKQRDEMGHKLIEYQQQIKQIHETLVCYLTLLVYLRKILL